MNPSTHSYAIFKWPYVVHKTYATLVIIISTTTTTPTTTTTGFLEQLRMPSYIKASAVKNGSIVNDGTKKEKDNKLFFQEKYYEQSR